MNWESIKGIVAKAAPMLGTVLGGPLGGAAGSLIAAGLGVEESPEAVMQAISADPQALAKVKEIESNNQVEIQRLVTETTIAKEQGWTERYKAMVDADGQSTRPQIAMLMAWALLIPYVVIGCAMAYAIFTKQVELVDMWPTLLAYLSIPLAILNKYFGELRKEQGQRLGMQQPSGLLGSLFGGEK
ncbi:MAG: hypothetical protein KAT62_00745 [Desulfuromonadales bacterium]|nr:hypothetical protein [Desulfuromonadales bacterium]